MSALDNARTALARAFDNQRSSFYRDLYAARGFDARGAYDWRDVPLSSKADLLATPVARRIFVPLAEVGTITFTSGTSGKGILIVPRRLPPPSPSEEPLYPGRCLMSFFYYTYSMLCARNDTAQRIISGDPKRLPQSAQLLREAGVDALHGPPSVLMALAGHLSAQERERIAYLEYAGDRLSRLQQGVLSELYPRAQERNLYASREIGQIAYSSQGQRDPFLLTPQPDLYLELLDSSGARGLEELGEPVEGELVVSTLYNAPFPYIRYRTGDRVRVHPSHRGAPLIEVLGRAEEERVRLPGGELLLAELERAIARIFGTDVADFQCQVGEERQGGAIVTTLSITLMSHRALVLGADAALRLARELRVNRERTWHDGVMRGLYAPLVVTGAPAQAAEGKRKNIIDTRR